MMIPSAAQRDKFADVYLVYELMDTDLHQIIRSPQPLSEDHVQYFTYQARTGLGRCGGLGLGNIRRTVYGRRVGARAGAKPHVGA